ncbi:MAG: LysR substrate-binding domain-containing protein [Solimonas sp.]
MQLRHLRHFVALVDHGGFGRAAQTVHLSQPAFSRSIQTLEQELGCLLVDRAAPGLRLTGQGEILKRHAPSLLRDVRAVIDEIARYDAERVQLHFGSGPGPAASLIPAAVAAFMTEHESVRLNCEVAAPVALAARLRGGGIEFLIADYRYFLNDPRYRIEPLRERRGGVFCRRGHPLAQAQPATLSALRDYRLVSMHIDAGNVPSPAQYGRAVDLECNTLEALVAVVRGSDALGISALDAISGHLDSGELQCLTFDEATLPAAITSVHYGIVGLADAVPTPAAQHLLTAIRLVDDPGQARRVAAA